MGRPDRDARGKRAAPEQRGARDNASGRGGNGRGTRAKHEALPPGMGDAVDEFADHLAGARNRSAHTVRAYVGDVVSLLDHATRMGHADPRRLDVTVLRS